LERLSDMRPLTLRLLGAPHYGAPGQIDQPIETLKPLHL